MKIRMMFLAPAAALLLLAGCTTDHGPGMPRHYDKHAWIWAHNPAGTWASWNPALTCPKAG